MLRLLGLDIGTTTISAAVIDGENGQLIYSETVPNGADEKSSNAYNRTQNVSLIVKKVLELKERLIKEFSPISVIGVTGQMHGILYYDNDGNAVGPLYTWQDRSGDIIFENTTYAEYLSEKTGYSLASGYGLVTDFVLRTLNKVPNAVGFTTIHDYIVMQITGRKKPLMHSSDAASLGCFSVERREFDRDAIKKIGIPEGFLPQVTDEFAVAGEDINGIPVAVAIGDNQASIIGVARGDENVFVNIGTGSQISIITDKIASLMGAEIRPFFNRKNLIVGAPLFGGRSYSLLHRFFGECAEAFGGKADNIYGIMDRLSEQSPDNHSMTVDTRFCGTRTNPGIRGSVTNISEENFTPAELTKGFLWGMAEELNGFYKQMQDYGQQAVKTMVGSGNAIRKSRVLQSYLEEQFDLRLNIPVNREEASCGAAFFAAVASGVYKNLDEAQNINVHYINYSGNTVK